MTTQWRFTVENCDDNSPPAHGSQSVTLHIQINLQFFPTEAKTTLQLNVNSEAKTVISLGVFHENAEHIFSNMLFRCPLYSADPDSLDKEGLVRLVLGLALAGAAIRVRLTAATVLPSDEIDCTRLAVSRLKSFMKTVEIEDPDEQCVICLEELAGTRAAVQMTCKHVYHMSCIRKWWLNCSNTCPTCRFRPSRY